MMRLSDVNTNETVMISHIEGSGAFRARLSEMGFVTGKTVKKLFTSPVGNPIVFELMGGQIALRKSEAEKIQVTVSGTADAPSTTPEADIPAPSTDISTDIPTQKHRSDRHQRRSGSVMPPSPHPGCPSCGPSGRRITTDTPAEAGVITIALVGNPNCGKTSLFNAASGGHERTGNYSGVTVSSVVGEMVFDGRKIRLVDLPGTYSIRAFSPEEAYVAHELESGRIDAVINVLDTTNLERNLLLTMQLKERNLPLVGALNMYDEFEESQSTLDIEELSRRLDMPLYPTVARKRIGIDALLKKPSNWPTNILHFTVQAYKGIPTRPLAATIRSTVPTVAEKELIRKIWTQTTEATRPVRAPNANTKMWNAIPISDKCSTAFTLKNTDAVIRSPQR